MKHCGDDGGTPPVVMKRPAELHQPSSRSRPRRLERYDCPSHYLVRWVSRFGTIRVLHNQVFVSNTLNEDYAGLEDVDDEVFDPFFCYYHMGRHELGINKTQDIVSKTATRRARSIWPFACSLCLANKHPRPSRLHAAFHDQKACALLTLTRRVGTLKTKRGTPLAPNRR